MAASRKRRALQRSLFLAFTPILLAACSASKAQPVLTTSELLGSWSNHHGSTITFYATHRFSATGINLTPNVQGCADASGPGTWQFLSPQGVSGKSLTSYAMGFQVLIEFDAQAFEKCSVSLTSWEINPPVGLCLDFDPDSPCTGIPWTKE